MQRQFQFQPSWYLAILLLMAHGAVLFALYVLPLPTWAKIALTLLLLASLFFYVRRDARLSAPSSVITLALNGDDVVLTTRNGKPEAAQLLNHSMVSPWLTVLNSVPRGATCTRRIIIFPDSLDTESFRQLRVWLKWRVSA
ncbi:MAG: hypothetical protein Q7S51_08005 [Gallionellaceae bacterium]|nr:hypothetical protein [Gallionellaceae bacterium]